MPGGEREPADLNETFPSAGTPQQAEEGQGYGGCDIYIFKSLHVYFLKYCSAP